MLDCQGERSAGELACWPEGSARASGQPTSKPARASLVSNQSLQVASWPACSPTGERVGEPVPTDEQPTS